MRVNYKGMDKDYKYRIAEINFEESESEKVKFMVAAMAERGYRIDIIDTWAACEVEDKDEYRDFMKDWKKVKKGL